MRKKNVLLLLVCLLISYMGIAQSLPVIPLPQQVEFQQRKFLIEKKWDVHYSDEFSQEVSSFLNEMSQKGLFQWELQKKRKVKKGILFIADPAIQGKERYRLKITPEIITLSAATPSGIFYGIQTLKQLIDNSENGELPCCEINDDPRYEWRGFMLDESRHFFGKEKVFQILDIMAYHKLNKFHWHLTDEPGWRIEIKKYPKLTTIGGQGNWHDTEDPEVNYYTQDEIREIVAYAAARHIEVIPEIDMPGHATAANKAYPQYSGGGTPDHPDFTFNVGKEETYQFLADVLREVAALFPSPYLHIGGDEVSFGIKAWETDPHIQALMQRNNYTKTRQAEEYFFNRISDTVKKLDKILLGWDELLDFNPDTASTWIYWWRHDRPYLLKKSLENGYNTILCPRRPLYFDFIQHGDHKWGRVWGGFNPLEDVYQFPDKNMQEWGYTPEMLKHIRGMQANIWTERIQHAKRLDFMIFTRMCALAESAWTNPSRKDYSGFTERMENTYKMFDEMGIYYFDPRNPDRHPEPEGVNKKEKDIPMDFRD